MLSLLIYMAEAHSTDFKAYLQSYALTRNKEIASISIP
jgi:hypothetical protein